MSPSLNSVRPEPNSRSCVLRASADRFSAFNPSRGEKVRRIARLIGRSVIQNCAVVRGYNSLILAANPIIRGPRYEPLGHIGGRIESHRLWGRRGKSRHPESGRNRSP